MNRSRPAIMSPRAIDFARHALPNSVTILALFFGLTGLLFASEGDTESAIACVLIAAVLDACDGRLARATGVASKFGAELDSLSDVVCFGAVPAFTLYHWGLSDYGAAGWLACLALAGACALRLARFNVSTADPARPSWASHFFNGIPAPAGAFLAMLPIYVEHSGSLGNHDAATLALAIVPVVAGLMVSTWPTLSGKAISRKALRLLFVPSLALLVVLAFGLIFKPWHTLSLAALAYLWTLPLSKWRYDLHVKRSAGSL